MMEGCYCWWKFSDNSDPVDSTFFLTLQPTAVKDAAPIPSEYTLQQNYPNPFNPSTIIKYSLVHESNVKLLLFNSLGQLIKSLDKLPAVRRQSRNEFPMLPA